VRFYSPIYAELLAMGHLTGFSYKLSDTSTMAWGPNLNLSPRSPHQALPSALRRYLLAVGRAGPAKWAINRYPVFLVGIAKEPLTSKFERRGRFSLVAHRVPLGSYLFRVAPARRRFSATQIQSPSLFRMVPVQT
jgi:hypothetical protein